MFIKRYKKRSQAFTLVELLVACVLTSTVLLGIYQLFIQIADVELRHTVKWNDMESAESAATYLADIFSEAINYDSSTAILAQGEANTPSWIVLLPSRCVRLVWQPGQNKRSGELLMQSVEIAGPTIIDANCKAQNLSDLFVLSTWRPMPVKTLCSRLDELEILFQQSASAGGSMLKNWRGKSGESDILITVVADGVSATRFITPLVNGDYETISQ